MSRRLLVLAWVVVVLATSTTRAQIPFTRTLVPAQGIVFDNKPLTPLGRVGLQRHWYAAVPLAGAEQLIEINYAGVRLLDKTSKRYVLSGLLFAQTNNGNFYTYDAETGQLLWMAALGRRTGDAQPATANSRFVFTTSANFLFALDRATGRTVWTEDLGLAPSSPLACDEDEVLVGLTTGLVKAFRTNDKYPLWNWQTTGPVTSRPQPAGQVVAFGAHDGRLYVALEVPPTMLYRVATGGEIDAPLGIYGTRMLLVASADKNVYAVDLFTADVVWTYPSGAPVMQRPLVTDNDAYIVNTAGVLSAVDILEYPRTATPRWTTPILDGNLLAISQTRIYLKSRDGDLFLIDRARGTMLADPRATYEQAGVNLREYILAPTNEMNDRMYFGTPSGLLICLREIGQTKPRPLRDPNAHPFGFIPPEGIPTAPAVAPPPEPAVEPTPEPSEPAAPPAEVPAPAGEEAAPQE